MTVRAVVTASGRFHLGGAGYSPEGEVNVKGGGAIDDGMRAELDRALAVADRANNAVLQQHDQMDCTGGSDGGRADRRRS